MTCAICNQEGHDAEHCPSPLKRTVMSPDAKRSPLILVAIVGILLLTIGGAIGVYFLGARRADPMPGPVNPTPIGTSRPIR